jgi:16S rRNA (cytosine1402-N4)-methyltransferase
MPLMVLHTSVLLNEAVEWLEPGPGKIIIDGTAGLGGHAARILEKLGSSGRLIGFDKDAEALEIAKKNLSNFGDRVMLVNDDYKNIATKLKEMGIAKADGILLDLGVSSFQLDKATRGFSFKEGGPLDMRMDQSQHLTAKEIVNHYPKQELLEILWRLGEERYARRIVDKIIETREAHDIETTDELASLVSQAVPKEYRYGRIHPATRTFQAIRIAVNSELDALEEFLSHATEYLGMGGKIVIISFHSLEDRAVKWSFRKFQNEGIGKILTKKPLLPSETEMSANPRARSAKMRVFQKTNAEAA